MERQIVIGKNMSVPDSARFMAMVSVAEADAIQSVYEAKYHYQFWRPITAIRNGDIDGNPETERINMGADRSHAVAPGVSVCALHRKHSSGDGHRSNDRYQ